MTSDMTNLIGNMHGAAISWIIDTYVLIVIFSFHITAKVLLEIKQKTPQTQTGEF